MSQTSSGQKGFIGGNRPESSEVERARRVTALHQWMTLRIKYNSSTRAARELGYTDAIMMNTAKRLGVKVPNLKQLATSAKKGSQPS